MFFQPYLSLSGMKRTPKNVDGYCLKDSDLSFNFVVERLGHHCSMYCHKNGAYISLLV